MSTLSVRLPESLHKRQKEMAEEGIARGEKAILEGRVVSHADAKKRMARWLE